ncbi:MAG TPA: fimbrial protein [Scandinavium sp.]|jgi:type 1 fimbria pilin|uniref:fimbrial protein n=1 Tax=Scandinavium sp. TaxID=2830653 RepID=UPI002E34011A|nr:fimbrial protein [Scandinavium sp.]HEX4501801.1 fimbrial protein [Scandinavium sp.]
MSQFNKTVMAIALAASLLSVGSANAYVGLETHELAVSGNLISNPCAVNAPGFVDFGDVNVETLPIVPASGVPQGMKTYSIGFTGCNEGQMAQVSVSGTADSVDSALLGNTSTEEDAATNVAVGFWQAWGDGKQIAANSGLTDSHLVDDSTYDNSSLDLLVALVKPEDKAATLGEFKTRAQIKITYL